MLDFRFDLIDDLIDSFCSRKIIGRPCSLALAQLDRLNSSFDHWPDYGLQGEVCSVYRQRHETFCHCSHCGVSLCAVRGKACQGIPHTL